MFKHSEMGEVLIKETRAIWHKVIRWMKYSFHIKFGQFLTDYNHILEGVSI